MSQVDPAASPSLAWAPQTEAERDAVREQLERILATSLFKASKRYPGFLRYVVEETLQGRAEHIKERTLGAEVFGRPADYDTTEDHVVRTAAGEVRKRIAQYYVHPGRRNEIRIELPFGSYVPQFRLPAGEDTAAPALPAPATRRTWPAWLALGALLGGLAVLVASRTDWAPPSALDRFWDPVLRSPAPVLVCLGQGTDTVPADWSPPPGVRRALLVPLAAPAGTEEEISVAGMALLAREWVNLADGITAFKLASHLQSRGKTVQIRGESGTNFGDLRSGPVVLVGALNNGWTQRLMGRVRFTFELNWTTYVMRVRDERDPVHGGWAVDASKPYLQLTEDYAVISRVLDPTTERMVVVAGGLNRFGTTAAGEFLTDGTHMEAFARQAPRGWERRNMQIVIATRVIHGHSGPPRVVTSWFW